ncbi:MAG TPA: class I adenylate-forming enzyme family protein [Stellaceae bacterium]|nr:class I adenylate-forming enzyme family protein [Stellaceae bacterium]
MPHFTNLGDLIDRTRNLEKIAIIDTSDKAQPREISFAALDAMARGVARGLRRRGLARGERVAILALNCVEYLAAYYGILRAGLVAVPVNFKFPRATIDFVLRDSGAKLVFCDAARRANCPADLPTIMFGAEFTRFLDEGAFEAVTPKPDEPAMFLYTSGSTGRPKGVVLSHQSHLWVVAMRMLGQDLERHRYLIAAPLYHMNALALAKLASAAHATIVLQPQFAARDYIAAIGRHRCTWLTAVPPMIAMMLRERDMLARTDLSSVEFVRMGSAPVSPSLWAALASALPRAKASNVYGTTEAGPIVFGPHPKGLKQPPDSVGYPHPQVELRLVADRVQRVEQGVLEMKCPAVMLGYHNRPDLAGAITPDGFYVTKDVFRRDRDGFYYFVGRSDDMFVCGGENIYPGDVEHMLETHPAIANAAVVPIDDEIKGQKPVAFVVRREGASLTADEVKRHALANATPNEHPRFVWFLDRLPLASTNKIDRAALIAMAKERVRADNAATPSAREDAS